MRYFVTGCAGFIGSHLVDRLLKDGHQVIGYDNYSTGRPEFIDQALQSGSFTLVEGDVLDEGRLTEAMRGADLIFHLAANADVRFGTLHPRKDLELNTLATSNVLEAARTNKIGQIAFSSTGAIYGEPEIFPTPEDAPFPVQTSLYGASKLACEGLIEAYCEGFGLRSWIFRFVSILGPRYSHGHVFDFFKQLRANPNELHVLGDGTQSKSYLHVQDCVDAMVLAVRDAEQKINIFNLGTDEHCSVGDSIGWITAELGVEPRFVYSGGSRGWIGDSPFVLLDCSRICALGWRPERTIQESVVDTLRYLQANPWLLDRS